MAIQELWPLITVRSAEASAAFYRDKLGFEMVDRWEPKGELRWCRMQRTGSR